ncbi:MAG: class I SAM-dependent methyltransferase [Chloroflexi bacterium]|nr:class I SAM-dependent methyltransferase [Chloroflexota bacterium]
MQQQRTYLPPGRRHKAVAPMPAVDSSTLYRMYSEFAHLWDAISSPQEYVQESRYWRDTLRSKLGSGTHAILELGVGGGHNLHHFAKEFQVTAVDLSAKMLANSAHLNPTVEHLVGDMRTIRLERTFQAVLIHDAINYMLTREDLRAAIATARMHLEPGGVFIAGPDWFKETFPGTHLVPHINKQITPELTFVEYVTDPDPNDELLEWVFFYITSDKGRVCVEEDHHITGCFSREVWGQLLVQEGFTMETVPYPAHDTGQEVYLVVGTAV